MHPLEDQEPATHSTERPSILGVATDLTDMGRLIPHAMAQARRANAAVCLIHALNIPDDMLLSRHGKGCDKADRADARTKLKAASQQLQAGGVPCSIVLERGVAAEIILEAVHAAHASRLIVETHRHGSSGQKILGSVANALFRTVTVPIFIVGPTVPETFSRLDPVRILHPVSLGGNFRISAGLAMCLAKEYDAELILLHVVDPAILRGSFVNEILARKNRELEALKAEDQRGTSIRTIVSCGNTIQEMFRVCVLTECDWIVMGIERDFPWWSKTNSAAYQVIAQSKCPVVVMRETHAQLPVACLHHLAEAALRS